jgi:protein-tyrosine phosphatase
MYNEIISNLYLGDIQDAQDFRENFPNAVIICVLENRPENEPFKAYHIPIITESGHVHTEQLDHISFFIEALLDKHEKVLIHCAAGLERSPLTIAYFLKYSKGISLEEAYAMVKNERPQIFDRSIWLK